MTSVREMTVPAEPGFGFPAVVWASATPLVQRFFKGEGALLGVNLSLALLARPSLGGFAAQALVSAAVLGLMYFLNDLHDCEADLVDPDKDQRFVRFCVRERPRLWTVLVACKLATLGAALALLGPRSALAAAAVFAVNLLYSSLLKGRAVLDVLIVGLWGGLYASVPGAQAPLALVGMVAATTSMCHVFQMCRDRDADALNGIRTSAVSARWLPPAALGLAGVLMGTCLFTVLGPLAAASAALPLALHLGLRSNQAAWMLVRLHFGVVWLLALAAVM